jgi:hypothetical protein
VIAVELLEIGFPYRAETHGLAFEHHILLSALLGRFCRTVLKLRIIAFEVAYQIPGSNLFVRLA